MRQWAGADYALEVGVGDDAPVARVLEGDIAREPPLVGQECAREENFAVNIVVLIAQVLAQVPVRGETMLELIASLEPPIVCTGAEWPRSA